MKLLKYLWFRYILGQGFWINTACNGFRVKDVVKFGSTEKESLIIWYKKGKMETSMYWIIPYKKVEDKITILEEYYNKKFAYKHGIWH